jgi:hypothetical protein
MTEGVNFCIEIADLTVRLCGRYYQTSAFCNGYISEAEEPDAVLTVTAEQIEKEYARIEKKESREVCERFLFLKAIIDMLPDYGKMVFHGATVKAFDKGYIFTAPSGTGKSTHVSLLKKHFGEEITIVNGDKPIVGLKNGVATVFPSPWCGKEGWQTKIEVPLGGIVLLKRGRENSVKRIEPADYFKELFYQVFKPSDNEKLVKIIEIMNEISSSVPFYLLECDMSKEAAEASFEIMKNGF